MNKLQKGLHILSWIFIALLQLPLLIIGLPMVWIAISIWGRQSKDWPRLFWLWGNDEEGYPSWSPVGALWWYAVRNPIGNFRFLFKDREAHIQGWGPQSMEAKDLLLHETKVAKRWAWNGPFAGYRRVWLSKDLHKYSEIWVGWKIGSTVPGMGFTAQVRLNREIGT